MFIDKEKLKAAIKEADYKDPNGLGAAGFTFLSIMVTVATLVTAVIFYPIIIFAIMFLVFGAMFTWLAFNGLRYIIDIAKIYINKSKE